LLIGAITGLSLYAAYSFLLPILGLESSASQPLSEYSALKSSSPNDTPQSATNGSPTAKKPSSLGRTVADFRAERRKRKGEVGSVELDVDLSPTSQIHDDAQGKWHRRGMLEAPTILEEDDSDF